MSIYYSGGVSNEDLLRLRDLGLIYRNDSLGWISTDLGKQVVDSLEPDLASEYLKEKGITDSQALCQLPISSELPTSCVNGFEKPTYCSQRDNHLCQKCKDW